MPLDITPSLETEILHRAAISGKSVDQYLDQLIHSEPSESQKPNPSVADLLREIGFVEGFPSDLSINPKYMEGFGRNHDSL